MLMLPWPRRVNVSMSASAKDLQSIQPQAWSKAKRHHVLVCKLPPSMAEIVAMQALNM